MRRQADQKIAAVVVRLELGGWRTVLLHHVQNFCDPGGTALGEIQLFEEIADSSIAVAAADRFTGPQVRHPDRTVRAGKTQNHQIIRGDSHFNRLANLVGSVVNGIDHCFLDGGKRKVPETLSLGPVGVFDDGLFEIICLDIVQHITCDTGKRAFEGFLIKAIPPRAFRKPDHIDLCCRKESPRVLVEKEEADVFRQRRFRWPPHHIHLATKDFDREFLGLIGKTTAYLAQELFHQP